MAQIGSVETVRSGLQKLLATYDVDEFILHAMYTIQLNV